jgi:2-keto-4-pentenoate hydratase/2-oxohepta-3-ene-1,7-dioic acid hydratase in catechol pathway
MRLATFSSGDTARPGIIVDDGVLDICKHIADAPRTVIDVIASWQQFRSKLDVIARQAADFKLSAVKLHAPVLRPRMIFAIGLNYSDHIAESGLETPQHQIWFAKAVTAVTGPFDPIELPMVSQQLDYEGEMVAVIGKRCRNVPRERAKEVIFGYCAGDDVSVRDWQLRTSQWLIGKSFDSHAPIGPWITTADEIDPHSLGLRCLVNGEQRQKTNTRHMVFDCYSQVEFLTRALTLEPGDLLFTGTCGGVAAAHKPPRWLQAGDIVRVEIEGLGAIENRVHPGPTATSID